MSKIKVALRVRPLSSRERDEKFPIVVQVDNNSAFITDIRVPEKPAADSRQRFRQFDFDHAFWLTECSEWGATQEEVYNEMAPALEKSILQGYNACLLAYGQSGTGKTHTMLGTKTDPGLIPRLCNSLWEKLRQDRENSSFRMEVSFMEIYREKVRDLLTPDKPLKLREHPQNGPHVQDLTRVEVTEEIGLVDLLWEGERRRAIGTTGSNRRSSRSHAIWTLYLTYRNGPDFQNLITNQVHLVDLAGSEKADLTATKHLLAEGADINRSLVSLGNVISSLAEKLSYIPYRDSALTWLLKDSLGGNANTSIIITASPASCSHAQTLNSLRFAQRARLVENKPEVNLTSCPNRSSSESYIASIFDIRKDISRLANILKVAQNNGGILRGLTPRNGWNRLISAIESWNHVEEGHSKSLSRGNSTETTSASTMTNSSVKSLDVMVQPSGGECKPADLHYEDARNCSSASVPVTPCRKANPSSDSSTLSSSSSIKCLTWAQSEIVSIPKPPTPAESEDEYISPPETPKIHHLKYVIPVHFPTSHHVESEARMSERIHRNLKCDYPEAQNITPTITPDLCESTRLLIRNQIPTLVSPQKLLDAFDGISTTESSTTNSPSGDCHSPMFLGAYDSESVDESYSLDFQVKPTQQHYVLAKGTGRKRTHRAPPRIKEFVTPKTEELFLFESTDEGEFSDCLEIELNQSANKNYRTVDLTQVHINDTPTPPFTSLEYYSDTNSNASTKRSTSSSSSSSYESLVLQKPVGHVKVVEKSVFNFPDDHVSDVAPDDFKILEKKVTAVSFGAAIEVEEKLNEAEEVCEEENAKKPVEQSAFKSFYRRELQQLDQIGKQIKSLQNLAQRYDVLKPYLKKIEDLQDQDFSLPDPEIDPLIEHCSGWNVDIEFRKVQNEVGAISKILKNNPGDKVPRIPQRDSSSASNHSHQTSSTSIATSDSYSMVDPNSRRGSNASTFDLPRPKYPSLISTFTISSDLDSSFSVSAPNSSKLSFNVSQSLSQPDVSMPTQNHQNSRKFNIPPELSQPLALNFDYCRRREVPPWTPTSPTQHVFQSPSHHMFQSPAQKLFQSPPSQHPHPAYQSPVHQTTHQTQMYQSPMQPQFFQNDNQGFFPAPPSSCYGMPNPMTYPPYSNTEQQWRPYPTSPPEVKNQFNYPMNGLNGKSGYSPPTNSNGSNGYPSMQNNVWSPVNYPASPPKMNGYKVDPFSYPPHAQQYQQSPPDYPEYKGYEGRPQHYSSQSNNMNNVQVGGSSPYRSLSIEGDFSHLSTSSFCKSCAMEFCSCQDSLRSSINSQEFMEIPLLRSNKDNPPRVKGQSRRPNHLRSVFSSYNTSSSSQFSP